MSTPPVPLDPVYCRKCKKAIQADAQFCPYCGKSQVAVPVVSGPPPIRPENIPNPKQPSPKRKRQILFYYLSLGTFFVLLISAFYSSYQDKQKADKDKANWQKMVVDHNKKAFSATPIPTPEPSQPTHEENFAKLKADQEARAQALRDQAREIQRQQQSQQLLARITAVGNLVANEGGQMNVHGSTIRVTVPGGRVDEYSAQRLAKTLGDRIGSGMTIRVLDDAGVQRAVYTAW